MKKHFLSFIGILMLMLLILPSASADTIYPAPDPISAGDEIDHLVAVVQNGSPVSASLPEELRLDVEEDEEGSSLYLRGVLDTPGSYDCIISVGSTSYRCPLVITPAVPELSVSEDVSCYPGDVVQLSVSAFLPGEGDLRYQWYAENSDTVLSESAVLQPDTGALGSTYYHCVVTNNGGGLSSSATSPEVCVTVEELEVLSLQVESLPEQIEYTVGDTLDTAGLSLHAELANGSSRSITEGFDVSPTILDMSGQQTIDVSYQDQSCSFTVNVQEAEEVIEGIGVLTLPAKTSYQVGDTLKPEGLSVRVYTNTGFRDVSEGLSCSPESFSQAGAQTVTVSYGEQTCTFTVQVEKEAVPVSLSVSRLPDKTSYMVGDTIDITGLVLQQIQDNDKREEISSGFTCTPSIFTKVGQQEVTVYYGDLSCRFHVNVSAFAPSATPAVTRTAESSPEVTDALRETASPQQAAADRRQQGSKTLFVVIVVASLLALAVLGVYVFVMNRGGVDEAIQAVQDFWRRIRKR